MKRAVSVLLIICMAFCAGCGEANPTVDVEAQLLEADRLFFEGNYEEVILTLETVLEVEPATVRGYLRLSDAYIAKGEEDKALELLRRGFENTGDEQIAARIQGMTQVIDGIAQVAAQEGVQWTNGNTLLLDTQGNTYWCGYRWVSYEFERISTSYDEVKAIPTLVEGLPPLKSCFNNRGFCGVTPKGDLYVWGEMCGSLIGNHDEKEGPIKIWENIDKAIQTSGGILALKNDGRLYSRGWNIDGILGIGQSFVEVFDQSGVSDIGDDYYNGADWLFVMEGVRDIKYAYSAYYDESDHDNLGQVCLAITQDNKLYGWGLFGAKEKDGKIYKDAFNIPQLLMTDIRDAGVTGDGRLFYVTMNGRLEYVPLSKALDNPEPTVVPIADAIVMSVSCGGNHVCAVDTAGILYVSGSNRYGQLGIDQSEEEYSYEDVVMPLGDIYVRQASAGAHHTCALLGDGTLLTWGNNQYGQLGNGRMGKQHVALEPMRVLDNVECVFDGGIDSAAVSQDGILYRAGKSIGSIFTAVRDSVQDYVYYNTVITKDGDWKRLSDESIVAQNVVYAYDGPESLFYVDEEGRLWGTGNNYSGELGLGTRNDSASAESDGTYSLTFELIMDGIEKCVCDSINVAGGPGDADINGSMTIILTEDGDVLQCGANPNTGEFVLKPQRIASGMRDIDINGPCVYMISENDDLYLWGWPHWEIWEDRGGILQRPTKVYSGVKKIDADGLMLDTEGKVYTFGFDTFLDIVGKNTHEWSDSLGIPQGTLICKQVELPGTAIDIAASRSLDLSYFAVLKNGDLYAWGDNQYGQLGLGDAGSDENIFEVKLPQ